MWGPATSQQIFHKPFDLIAQKSRCLEAAALQDSAKEIKK